MGDYMTKKSISPKKISLLGLALTLAMMLSFVESQVPHPITGVKLGLPNIVTVFMLYKFSWKESITVNLIRIVLMSILFGNVESMAFGLSGAFLSLTGMIILKMIGKFSCVSVSVTGGILHNVGQLTCAVLLTRTSEIALLFPIYLFSGIISGAVIGIISGILVEKINNLKI